MTAYNVFNPNGIFAGGDDFSTRKVTVLTGQNASGSVLPRGTLLGVVTATGKYKISATGASDGSQTPTAVLADDVDTSGGDVICDVYAEGQFAYESCNIDSSWTIDTLNAALQAEARDIYFRSLGPTP